MQIIWPNFDVNEDHLLYLLGLSFDQQKAVCEEIANLNPLALKARPENGTGKENLGKQLTQLILPAFSFLFIIFFLLQKLTHRLKLFLNLKLYLPGLDLYIHTLNT